MGKTNIPAGSSAKSKKKPVSVRVPVDNDNASENLCPIPRARVKNGKAVLPPSESALKGNLEFKTKALKGEYAKVRKRSIIASKFVDVDTLHAFNMKEEFDRLVDNIGWKVYFEIRRPTFIELTREFYTTFKFQIPKNFTLDSPRVVQYRLMGKQFNQSITQFNLALGVISEEFSRSKLYKESKVDFDDNFLSVREWRLMSNDRHHYDPSQSKSSYLLEPVWKYIHRFLAFGFSGRKSSSLTCTKTEFFFLWAMVNNVKVNLGYWLADQFASVIKKPNKPLILGFLITHLACNLKVLDIDNTDMHLSCEMEPLDVGCLTNMRIVVSEDGVPKFLSPGSLAKKKSLKRKRSSFEGIEESDDASTSYAHESFEGIKKQIDDLNGKIDVAVQTMARAQDDLYKKVDAMQATIQKAATSMEKFQVNLSSKLDAFFRHMGFLQRHLPPPP